MSVIAKAGVDHVVDSADVITAKALEAVGELESAAVDAAGGAIRVGDVSFKALMAEAETAREHFLAAARALAEAVVAPLP